MGQRHPSRPKAITRPVFKAQLTHPHKSRMQFPQNPHPHWAQNGRISTIRVPHLKYAEGNCMRNWPPADERRPQGLRAHVRTLTMSTFCCPSAQLIWFLRCADTKLAQQEPRRATAGQNSPDRNRTGPLPGQNSPCSPKMTQFGVFCPHMANFFTLTPTPGRAGRTFSRTGHSHVATMQPMTPLRPLVQASMKPPSPLHTPEQQPLKPPTPLQVQIGPKWAFHRSQRRWRFHSAARKC